jgi:hypothetical protein
VLIDGDLLHFCAAKTREVAEEHDKACGAPFGQGLPRSAEDLHWIMCGRHGFPIHHKVLDKRPSLHWTQAKFRSFYIPYNAQRQKLGPDATAIQIAECWIFYAHGMSPEQLRFYKTKELLQIHLWQEALATRDIVDLVHNMIVRETPQALDLNLGHSTTSDTLGEVAAMEFLFPLEHRLAYLEKGAGRDGVAKLADDYKIPAFVVQRALANAENLKDFFRPSKAADDAKAGQ